MRVYSTAIRRVSALVVVAVALVAVVPASANETMTHNLPSGQTAYVSTAWNKGDLIPIKVSDTRVDVCGGEWGTPEYTIWRSGNNITLGRNDCVIIRGRSGLRWDWDGSYTRVRVW